MDKVYVDIARAAQRRVDSYTASHQRAAWIAEQAVARPTATASELADEAMVLGTIGPFISRREAAAIATDARQAVHTETATEASYGYRFREHPGGIHAAHRAGPGETPAVPTKAAMPERSAVQSVAECTRVAGCPLHPYGCPA